MKINMKLALLTTALGLSLVSCANEESKNLRNNEGSAKPMPQLDQESVSEADSLIAKESMSLEELEAQFEIATANAEVEEGPENLDLLPKVSISDRAAFQDAKMGSDELNSDFASIDLVDTSSVRHLDHFTPDYTRGAACLVKFDVGNGASCFGGAAKGRWIDITSSSNKSSSLTCHRKALQHWWENCGINKNTPVTSSLRVEYRGRKSGTERKLVQRFYASGSCEIEVGQFNIRASSGLGIKRNTLFKDYWGMARYGYDPSREGVEICALRAKAYRAYIFANSSNCKRYGYSTSQCQTQSSRMAAKQYSIITGISNHLGYVIPSVTLSDYIRVK